MKNNLKIFNNFFIIGLSYGSNLLLPILLIPHFIGKLGIELFGIVALTQSLMSYMNVLVDYHFSTIIVREISINRDDNSLLNFIFCRTLIVRTILLAVSLLVVTLIVVIYPPLQLHYDIAIYSAMIIVGQTLLPNWFLLGLEEVAAMAILNIVFKSIYIVSCLTFVGNPSDAILPNFFLGLTNATAGSVGLIYIIRKYKFTIMSPTWKQIYEEIKAGRLMVVSNLSVSLYTSGGPIILALFCSSKIVGEYVTAERILSIFRGFVSIYFQATYSRAASLMSKGKQVLNQFYRDTFPFVVGAVIVFSTFFFFSSDEIIKLIFRISSPIIAEYIRYLMIAIVIIVFNIPYYQRLLILAPEKANVVILTGCLISITLNFSLIPIFGATGCIVAVTITELFITSGLYYQNIKLKSL